MFSTHLPKISTVPTGYQFLGGAMLLALGGLMLSAVGAVAGGQVTRADQRQSLLRLEQNAVVYCVQTLGGNALNNCLLQARAADYSIESSRTASNDSGFPQTMAMAPRVVTQVLIPASLVALR